MGKRKMIFYGVAALFAVSGVAALPSGNITGGVGCLVIAAVCAFAGAKGKAEQQADKKPAPHVAPASTNERIAETIRTKLVGVTYDNEDGENRQDILSSMTGVIMLIVAFVFIMFALNHPEKSFPWNNTIKWLLYGVYFLVTVVLLIAPNMKK